jgi:hypothetical protein
MLEADTTPNQPESSETPEIERPAWHGRVWHFPVALLSAVVPGTGQAVFGARRKGSLLMAAFFLFFFPTCSRNMAAARNGDVFRLRDIRVCLPYPLVLYSSCSALLRNARLGIGRDGGCCCLYSWRLPSLSYAVIVRTAGFQEL